MIRSTIEIAEAFSRHRFEETYEAMLEGIRWNVPGADGAVGKERVIASCEEARSFLAGVQTTFDRVRVLPAGDAVVVETEATYVDGEDVSRVASCDVYDFAGDRLSAISSYNVELP